MPKRIINMGLFGSLSRFIDEVFREFANSALVAKATIWKVENATFKV